MARLTPLSEEQARSLGQRFGIRVQSVEALDLGSVNSNFRFRDENRRAFFARIYEEQGVEGARSELRLLRALHREGVPTALPVPLLEDHEGGAVAVVDGKAASVYEWVQGIHLCNAQVTPERTRTLGSVLARVHRATPRLPALSEGRFGPAGIRERLDALDAETDAFDEVIARLRAKLDRYTALRDEGLPRGLIHGDLFRDNVLWRGSELVALLDFESASRGTFVYDVAVCLLAWCYTDSLRQDCARALLEGYRSERPLSSTELSNLTTEGAIACLRFATTRIRDFSLRCPPGQQPERDYERFLKRLSDLEQGAFTALVEARF